MDPNERKSPSPVHDQTASGPVRMTPVDKQTNLTNSCRDSLDIQDASEVMSTSSADLDLAVPVQTRNNKKVMMARRRKLVTSSATEQTTTLESSTGPQNSRRVRVPKSYVSGNYRAISRSPAIFTKIRKFKVNFNLPNGKVVPMGCAGDHTVAQIKDQLWLIMKELGIFHENPGLEDKNLYSIKYVKDCDNYELYEEQQIFQTLSIVSYWRAKNIPKGEFSIVEKKDETTEEKRLNEEICKLIGMSVYQLCSSPNSEVDMTRRLFIGVRRSAVSSRDPSTYSMEPELTLEELPPHIHHQLQGGTHIIVKIYSGTTFMTTSVPIDYTPFQVLNNYFPRDPLKKERLNLPRDSKVTNYVLKVCGRSIYLVGPARIIDFTYVRRCILKHCPIHLAIVPLLDSEQDTPKGVLEPDLVDDNTGLVGSYKQLSALNKDYRQVFAMALWDISHCFRVHVHGVDGLNETLPYKTAFVKVGIFHGGKLLTPMVTTREVPFARSMYWSHRLVLNIKTRNLPKAAQLCCYLYAQSADRSPVRKSVLVTSTNCSPLQARMLKSGSDSAVPLHWANMHLLNHKSILAVGKIKLPLCEVQTDSEGSQNFLNTSPVCSAAVLQSAAVLHVELDSYAHPVVYPNSDFGWGVVKDEDEGDARSPVSENGESHFTSAVDDIVLADPLRELKAHEQELIWRLRWNLASKPEALPRLLQTADWGNLEQVIEIHNLIQMWRAEGITLEVALQLLDSQYVDSEVRKLAVERLEELSNDNLLLYFLQLVQVLKFEPNYDSVLARFLLRRALQSKRIGHCFYWFLRSEMAIPEVQERFGLLLEAYLRGCGKAMIADLERQNEAIISFEQIATKLKSLDKKDRSAYLTSALSSLCLPQTFSPAYDPSLRIGKMYVHQCRFMDSKKLPLMLEFENVDPTCASSEPIRTIFKVGDDLRQDMLTLQMIKLMDKLWQDEGLNLYMTPYGCMSTGFEVGMIEVVTQSLTVAKIQKDYGGSLGALKDDCLYNWLKEKNSRTVDFEKAVERFVLSCAGYCVATFVLGIGDRHNDNIMLTESGCLFHIDFGHFLGNTKKFMGFKRERAPFVLTPDFVNIMGRKGSSTFQWFQDVCCQAYNAIRRRASLFINLFSMMKHTGIPELASIKDIDYLRSVLVLEKTEEEAAKYFKEKIDACLRLSWSTQLNWMAHNVVHA